MIDNAEQSAIERLLIQPRDFGFSDRDVALESDEQAIS